VQVFPHFGSPLAPYIVYFSCKQNSRDYSRFGTFRAWYNCLFFNSLAAILEFFLGFTAGPASDGFRIGNELAADDHSILVREVEKLHLTNQGAAGIAKKK
jgi:hypothetical protein